MSTKRILPALDATGPLLDAMQIEEQVAKLDRVVELMGEQQRVRPTAKRQAGLTAVMEVREFLIRMKPH